MVVLIQTQTGTVYNTQTLCKLDVSLSLHDCSTMDALIVNGIERCFEKKREV